MHLFPDDFSCHEASHLYHRRMRRGHKLRLKALVWRGADGEVRVTKPSLWNKGEPISHLAETCRRMGHQPLYCITLEAIASHN